MKFKTFISRSFALVGLMMLATMAFSQNAQTVKGKITDSKGETLPSVNVVIEGTTIGTVTDIDGEYQLMIPNADKDVLVFSFIGFQQQKIAVSGKTTIDVVLQEDAIGLDEVVAIGYGVVKKRDLTGAVSSVKSEDIQKTASSNAMQAMQAKVPGLDIQQSDGQAGSGLSLNLRGTRSISASNSPLILVDGVEYGSTLDINSSDIESMDILKDASSTAIYGSKGANGVIIITTKRGQAGKTKVNFNAFVSSNAPTNIPQVMYGDKEVQRMVDKANYQADAKTGDYGSSNVSVESVLGNNPIYSDGPTTLDIYNDKSYTDWLDVVLQNGLTQNYELSVSGGTEKTAINLSLGLMDEEGLMKNDEMNRYNIKTTIDHQISNAFKVGSSVLYTYKSHDKRQTSVFSQAMKMTTLTHAYKDEEDGGGINETPNPYYAAHCNPLLDEVDGAYQRNVESTRFFGNAYLQINPMKNLTFKSQIAVDMNNSRDGYYQDYQSVARYQSPATGYISSTYDKKASYTWDNTLNYNIDFGKSSLSAMIGSSANQYVYESSSTYGDCGQEHYYTSSFYDLSKIVSQTTTSGYTKYNMMSYFGRVNYNFDDKYLLTASVRADGASPLAEGHKWGYFPSVSGAWRISEEAFMENTKDWLSNLKFRASWGLSGNSAIDPYRTLSNLSSSIVYYNLGGSDIAGKIPSSMGNEELSWETTSSVDFGLDFSILDNRISGSVDYYINNTSDLLYTMSVPASSVYPSVIANVGSTKGSGIEVSLNTLFVDKKDFSWSAGWSYTTFKDEITELSEGVERNISGTSALVVGEAVSVYYDFEADGCWNVGEYETYKANWEAANPGKTIGYIANYGNPGTVKIVDKNGDGTLTDDDKVVFNRSPKHIFGMNNSFTYKDFSLSVLLYARLGGYISYGMNDQLNYESANWGDLDYWTVNNTDAKFPNPGAEASPYSTYKTSLMYEKADYFKIKDITLSYSLPKNLISKIGVNQIKVYGSLKNYFTFASIDNYDPERGGSINFPLAKQMVFGVNIEF